MYQLTEYGILRYEDRALIPDCAGNKDWYKYQKWLAEGNTPDPMPQPDIELLKAGKLSAINTAADAALASIISQYPETETLSWDKQEHEARNYLTDNTSATPLLDGIATGRGIDKALLAQKVIDKAEAFAVLSGQIFGKRQALETQTVAATTVDEVEAIEISF